MNADAHGDPAIRRRAAHARPELLVLCLVTMVAACSVTASPGSSTSPGYGSSITSAGLSVRPPATAAASESTASPQPSSTPNLAITGRIAFVHDAGEIGGVPETDLWLVDAKGGKPVSLTRDGENEFSPFWLLDGSRIVFTVFDFKTNQYRGRLASVLPDGGGRRDLGPVMSWDGVPSPNGRYVAWGGDGSAGAGDGITLLDRSTGTATLITTDGGTSPIWSPGSDALLVREPSLGSVAVVDVPSGSIVRFTKPNIEALVGWTTDGRSIVFSGFGTLDVPTWMAPRSGGPIVDLPPSTDVAVTTWTSPDGRWIAGPPAAGYGAKGYPISVWAAPTGAPTGLGLGLSIPRGVPSWSPGSNALVFASSSRDADYGTSALYVVGIDGGSARRLTSGPLDTSPSWGPAG